jgi:beta-lactamase superfamily II metal-dependent hydrolase
MFTIEMLPAGHGDALLVEYGDTQPPHRILIDGGTPGVYKAVARRLKELADAEGPLHFELLVITHIDDDHIGGVLALLEKDEIDVTFDDIWFNGYGHLRKDEDIDAFGPVQGERLTAVLHQRQLPWNRGVQRRSLRVHDDRPLPVIALDGGMELTLLSPDADKLAKLEKVWAKVCLAAGLTPDEDTDTGYETDDPEIEAFGPIDMDALVAAKFHEDKAEANGSSIAFLAEYEGRRVLFAADAHPTRLVNSIDRLIGAGERLAVDVCKLSHHGSDHNTSAELIDRLDCRRFLVSTSGARFRHPHRAAMARVIRSGTPGKEIVFNYRSAFTEVWDDADLQRDEGYTTTFPAGNDGIVITV